MRSKPMSALEKPAPPATEAVLVHDISPPHPRFRYFDEMVAETAKKTKGSLRIVINPGGRILYPGKSSLDAVRSGKVPLTLVNSVHVAAISPSIGFINQPFAMQDAAMAQPGIAEQMIGMMQTLVQPSGLHILALMRGADSIFIFKNRQIRRPEDLKGMKIRVAGEGVFQDIVRSFDAEPVVLPPAESTSAVERGIVDGVLTSPGGWVRQFGLSAPLGTVVPGLLFMTYLMLADHSWLSSLPTRLRQALVEAGRENVTEKWGTFQRDDSQVISDFTAQGASCWSVPANELPSWREKVEWITGKFAEDYPDVIRRYRAILLPGSR
jgi:TRAP-type C4-dicarboxylate transport system substrate-binding protein